MTPTLRSQTPIVFACALALFFGIAGCGGSSAGKGANTPVAEEDYEDEEDYRDSEEAEPVKKAEKGKKGKKAQKGKKGKKGKKAEEGKEADVAAAPAEPVPELAFPDEAFRAAKPTTGKPRSSQLPEVQRFKLPQGIEVYLIEQHDLPIVSMSLDFDGGARTDPPGKEGLASVCMDMLTEGTKDRDKLAFNEALADLGSRVDSYAGDDTQGLSMSTLSKHFDATLELFRNALLEPGMRKDDLDRLIARRLESLKQVKASPDSAAARVSDPVLYGIGHHKGRVITEASYQAITIDDCVAYQAEYLKPGGARLFVVGDMTRDDLKKRMAVPFESWTGKVPRPAKAAKPTPLDGAIFFVDIPGAAQSAVRVMHFGPQRKAADYMATELMSAVLGGGFASRINMNLREDKGYSYGARAGFRYSREDGVFVMSSSVRSDSTYQTVVEMLDEIVALKSGARAVTADELTREKNGAILGLPGQFATSRQALSKYRALVYFGLPLNYYNKYVAQVGKVSSAQVMKSAKKHLDLDNAKIVVVGDGSAPLIQRVDGKDVPLMKDGKQMTLLDGLRDLAASGRAGKGDLVILDADSNIVTGDPAAEASAAGN